MFCARQITPLLAGAASGKINGAISLPNITLACRLLDA
jgi:hypothetical protein